MRRKTSRSLLSIMLVLSMLFSMLPSVVLATDESLAEGYIELSTDQEYKAIVYVSDGGTGDGATSGAPVATMAAAYEKLDELMEGATASDVGKIVIVDTVTVSEALTGVTHDYIVHVTGAARDSALMFANTDTIKYVHCGPTVYDNIAMSRSNVKKNVQLIGYGPLTIGQGVTTDNGKDNGFFLVGAPGESNDNWSEDTWLLVHSGIWRNIYVGTNAATLNGNANLKMTGGEVTNMLGGTYSGSVSGNVSMTLTGEAKASKYATCGALASSGTVDGTGTAVFSDGAELGATFYAVYAGTMNKDTSLTLDNAVFSGKFGTSEKYKPEQLKLHLEATEGETLVFEASSDVTRTAQTLTGGGTLNLTNTALKISETVFGTTAVVIGGTPEVGKAYITAPVSVDVASFTCGVEGYTFASSIDETAGTRTWTLAEAVAPETYAVQISSMENGAVTAAPTSAAAGETVTLTVDPDDGYELDTLAVKDETGEEVAVNNNTFAMPASTVTVTASFKEIPAVKTSTTVYVSSAGNDGNAGTEEAPVATMAEAYAKLAALMADADEEDTGYIVIQDTVTVSEELTGEKHAYTVHISGGTLKISVHSYKNLGPTVYDDITLDATEASNSVRIIGCGPLTIGKDVTTTIGTSKQQFYLVGGSGGDGDTNLLVQSGTWRNIYAGTNADTMTGNANLTMTGGEVTNYLRGTYEGQVNGNVTVSIENGADMNALFSAMKDNITGTVTLNAVNATLSGTFNGVTNIVLNIEASSAEDPIMTITTPNDSADRKVTDFAGGGTLKLENNVSMTISGNVTGETDIIFDGEPTVGKIYVTAPVSVPETAFVCGVEGYAFTVADDGTNRTWMLRKTASAESYAVQMSTMVNGKVVASPTSAAEGETVSLTVLPDSGYVLKSLTVKDAQGNDVSVSNNTFTMPASAVTVSAEFEVKGDVAASAVVYVSASGNDADEGTESEPVATLAQAYALLSAAAPEAGKIVLMDTLTLEDDLELPAHSYPVVITGQDAEDGIASNSNLIFNGPTTLENLTLECTTSDLCYIVANCNQFVIGENVTCKEGLAYFNLVGGTYQKKYEEGPGSDLTIQSGRWNNVYAAAYNGSSSSRVFNGDAKLTVSGGTITTLTGGCFGGKMTGDSTAIITGGEITGLSSNNKGIFAGGMYGSFTGDLNLIIAGETADSVVIADTIAGGMRQSNAAFTGTVTISISGATLNGGIDPDGNGTFSGTTTVNLAGPLALNESVTMNRFTTGTGALSLGRSAYLTITDSVSGNTDFTVTKPTNGKTYITAPVGTAENAFNYTGSDGTMTIETGENAVTWTAVSENEPVGLTLQVPSGVSLTLYKGLEVSSSKKIEPAKAPVTENGITTYFYEGLSVGGYCYQVEDNNKNDGATYYRLKKNVYYSDENVESGRIINADPGKMAGDGFEPGTVSKKTGNTNSWKTIKLHTDELMNGGMGKSWIDEYDALLTSPYFLRREAILATDTQDGIHQQTTHEEMLTFLNGLDDENDNLYLYTIGQSPAYEYDFVVAVFTQEDLSSADTLEKAAEILNANEKPTVQYQAQIHSTEPAATEGALVMAKQLDGAYGSDQDTGVLNDVDVVMIPRINADGAYNWTRYSVETGDDMNRDYLYMNNEEIRMVVGVYNLFLSEVTIDAHEYTDNTESSSGNIGDILMTGNGGALNNPWELTQLGQEIMNVALNRVQEEDYGLYGNTYQGSAFSSRAVVGASYPAVRGGLGFLLETRGIYNGMGWIDRRVMAQYATASTIISYVADNADTVMDTVHTSRAKIVEQGATYEEDDLVVLDHVDGSTKQWEIPVYSYLTGQQTGTKYTTWKYTDAIGRSRIRPTAYVIPKNLETAEDIVEVMSRHAIQYYELDAGTAVKLQQYYGESGVAIDVEAKLTEETVVTFENGAYVFPMNQVPATILAVIMEPDVNDSEDTKSTLVRMNLMEQDADGYLPLYRYCYDLVDGKIVPEGTVHTVTFMDGETQVDQKGINHGVSINRPNDPTKDGFTFAGWYTDAELTSAYDFTTPVIRNLTLYAKWTRNAVVVPPSYEDDYDYEPTYRVEADTDIENGSVSVSPKYAEKGDTVSVTVNPDKGYELDELTVTDRKGNELTVTYKNGKYTFQMPAGKVAVNATFVPVAQIPFTDVAVDDWYYDAVRYAYVNDIMAGMGDNKFAPNAELLRSMVAQVLYNLDEDRYTAISSLFSDVVAGEWYVEAINWAVAEGIFAGYGNGTFGTMDSVTREQLAMILYNYAVSKGYVISGSTTLGMYADADMTSDWAVGAMEWAVANGILRATDGLLTPNVPASRAEVAYAMMQFCELFKN